MLSNHQKQFEEHKKAILRAKTQLDKANSGKNIQTLVVKPIPDLIMVDFDSRKIFGVEISIVNQKSNKKKKYSTSGFAGVIFGRYGIKRLPQKRITTHVCIERHKNRHSLKWLKQHRPKKYEKILREHGAILFTKLREIEFSN